MKRYCFFAQNLIFWNPRQLPNVFLSKFKDTLKGIWIIDFSEKLSFKEVLPDFFEAIGIHLLAISIPYWIEFDSLLDFWIGASIFKNEITGARWLWSSKNWYRHKDSGFKANSRKYCWFKRDSRNKYWKWMFFTLEILTNRNYYRRFGRTQ